MTDPIASLASVLRAENAALADFDVATAGALLTRKQDAIAAVDALPRSFTLDRARMREIAELTATNRKLLEFALEAQKAVLAILARAARQAAASAAPGAYVSPFKASTNQRGIRPRENAFAVHASV